MRKKLQVFISSTFTDLIEERQAAVQAVLSSGHIPAGMELFTAGDASQQDIIKKWIEESDAYMLILGGRYGSLMPDKVKSYTHWEFDYAGEIGKPRFALVLKDEAIQNKIEKITFKNATEQDNPQMYKNFRKELMESKLVKQIEDLKDIENGIFRSIREIEQRNDLHGWVSGKDVPDVKGLMEENMRLMRENTLLSKENVKYSNEIEKLKVKTLKATDLINGYEYKELIRILSDKEIKLPKAIHKDEIEIDYLTLFLTCKDSYATGIKNAFAMSKDAEFLYFKVAPTLMSYGLVEMVKAGQLEKMKTSKEGHKFLARIELESKPIIADEQEVDIKSKSTKPKITAKKEVAATVEVTAKSKPRAKATVKSKPAAE